MTGARTIPIEVTDAHGTRVLRPLGELDAASAECLRETMASVAGPHPVVIDLDQVAFIDSAGLAVLIGGIRRHRDADGDAAIACDRQPLRRLLHTAGLDRVVNVTGSVAEAAAAITDGP